MKRSVAEIHAIHPDQTGGSRTIAESAYRRIRQDILWGRFAPGSPLRSDELRARYGVGVSPLHEALTRALAPLPKTYEIICVDDGSKDGSAALLEELERVGGDVPANAAAWERFVRQVREQSAEPALRRTA